jgi:hypothetical protein
VSRSNGWGVALPVTPRSRSRAYAVRSGAVCVPMANPASPRKSLARSPSVVRCPQFHERSIFRLSG